MTVYSPDKYVKVNPPYTLTVVALLYARIGDDPLVMYMPMTCMVQQGHHRSDGESEQDIVERARFQQAEAWPAEKGLVGEWEFLCASISTHLVGN